MCGCKGIIEGCQRPCAVARAWLRAIRGPARPKGAVEGYQRPRPAAKAQSRAIRGCARPQRHG
eukprot:217784-Chlamydomonas_euryale.AAC.1